MIMANAFKSPFRKGFQRQISKNNIRNRHANFHCRGKELIASTNSRLSKPRSGDTLSYYKSNNADDGNFIDLQSDQIPPLSKDDNPNNNNTSSLKHEGEEELETPDVRKIILFAIPAIGIWLCSPILSLIDTSAVGLLAGTSQQAALNPAITITEDGALLVSFMYTATTNLVAAAHEYDRGNTTGDKSVTRTTIITALQLGAIVGLFFGLGLGTTATFLLKSLIGKGQEINMEVLSVAERYVKIRSLGMPAAVMIGSAQSACLGMKDIRSPLIVMVAAAVVNLIGDLVFVRIQSPLWGGAAGTAWATVLSQYVALYMFLHWLKMDPSSNAQTKKQKDSHGSASSKGILNGHFKVRDLFKLPSSKPTIKKFWPYAIPVTTTSIGRVSGYVAMSHVVSSALGTVDMAAQQIVLAFFLCLIPMCDSLNLTAQSFVPGIFEFKGNTELRTRVMRKTIGNFLKAGGIFGLALTIAVVCIPLISRFFSHDLGVIASVNSTTPYLAIYALLSGIVCSGEGLLLGQKDLMFLSRSFTAFFFIVPYILLRVKHVALKGVEVVGLSSVWRVFTLYQIVRCSMWLLRIRQLSNRLDDNTHVSI